MSCRWIAVCLLFCCFNIARADAPATQPAGPRETLNAFFSAVAQGRPDDVAPLCLASDVPSLKLVNDFKDLATAMKTLRAAVAAKFGADAVDAVTPGWAARDDIDAMTQTIDGDRAQVVGDHSGQVTLVKSDGHWKIDFAAMRRVEGFPANPHAFFSARAATLIRTAVDIKSGRLDSVEAATEALRAREDGIAAAPATMP